MGQPTVLILTALSIPRVHAILAPTDATHALEIQLAAAWSIQAGGTQGSRSTSTDCKRTKICEESHMSYLSIGRSKWLTAGAAPVAASCHALTDAIGASSIEVCTLVHFLLTGKAQIHFRHCAKKKEQSNAALCPHLMCTPSFILQHRGHYLETSKLSLTARIVFDIVSWRWTHTNALLAFSVTVNASTRWRFSQQTWSWEPASWGWREFHVGTSL